MKKLAILLGVFLFLGFAMPAEAQMSRKEKKAWKKQKKRLDPEEFKNLVEEKEALDSRVSGLNAQVNGFESKLNEKEQQLKQLQSQLKDAQNQLQESKASISKMQQEESMDVSGQKTRVAKGVVFRVQIGAFKNKDLAKYFDQNGSFDGEVDNSMQQYTLGTFQDYWEADKFKKYLRAMGVKDAWIVAYKDEQRVPLKDVLEGVI